MYLAIALLLTMRVSLYAPEAGGINGNLYMADGNEAHAGYAACGPRYPFGTVFEIMVDMSEYGVPQVVECRDRGGYVGNANLDLVIRTGDPRKDLEFARAWGKRSVPVRVWANWGDYVAGTQAEYDKTVQAEAAPPADRSGVREQMNPTPMP